VIGGEIAKGSNSLTNDHFDDPVVIHGAHYGNQGRYGTSYWSDAATWRRIPPLAAGADESLADTAEHWSCLDYGHINGITGCRRRDWR
jgi:hypothetical protein